MLLKTSVRVVAFALVLFALNAACVRPLCLYLYGHPVLANICVALVLFITAFFAMAGVPGTKASWVGHAVLLFAAGTTVFVSLQYPDLRDDYGLPNLLQPFVPAYWGAVALTYAFGFEFERRRKLLNVAPGGRVS
jgi:hypothetical protein